MSNPHKCPVCGGSGMAPLRQPMVGVQEACHACDRGIVWEPRQPEPWQEIPRYFPPLTYLDAQWNIQ